MSAYSLSMLLSWIFNFGIGLFVFLKNRKSKINIYFAIYCLILVFWILGCFMESSVRDSKTALFWDKVLYTGCILAASIYLHFCYLITQKKDKKSIIKISYITAIFWLIINYTPALRFYFIKDIVRKYPFRFIADPNFLWYVFVLWFNIQVFIMFIILFLHFKNTKGAEKNQAKYLLIAFMIMITAGSFYFLLLLNIVTPPIDPYLLIIYTSIMAYAIVRHRLLDIEVIIRRSLVFAGLFLVVFGLYSFGAMLSQQIIAQYITVSKWVLMMISVLMITLFYHPLEQYLIRITDRVLFQKKYDYRKTLRDAARGMGRVTDINELVGLIVHLVSHSIRPKHNVIFIYDSKKAKYLLMASRGREQRLSGIELDKDNVLVQWLNDKKEILTMEEIDYWLKSEGVIKKDKALSEKLELLKKQMEDIRAVICVPSFTRNTLIGFLSLDEKMSRDMYSNEDIELLSTLSHEAAIAIENAINYKNKDQLFLNTVSSLAQAVEAKDPYTRGHTERVTLYAVAIEKQLRESPEFRVPDGFAELVRLSGLMHDIGKIGIDDRVLKKPAALTNEEWLEIKKHPGIGARIIEPIEEMEKVAGAVKHHHERYDGKGYPDGLARWDIPLAARVLAVADTYDAMTSDRPYRKGLPNQVAIDEITKNAGMQFDPLMVQAFLQAYAKGEIEKIQNSQSIKQGIEL